MAFSYRPILSLPIHVPTRANESELRWQFWWKSIPFVCHRWGRPHPRSWSPFAKPGNPTDFLLARCVFASETRGAKHWSVCLHLHLKCDRESDELNERLIRLGMVNCFQFIEISCKIIDMFLNSLFLFGHQVKGHRSHAVYGAVMLSHWRHVWCFNFRSVFIRLLAIWDKQTRLVKCNFCLFWVSIIFTKTEIQHCKLTVFFVTLSKDLPCSSTTCFQPCVD